MILLAIDTSASLCAACVYDTEADCELGRTVEDIGKGHAERLMAVISTALGAAGKTYADLGAIAVSVGPGSFTGVRVGVAAARGLALALAVPAVGVNTLEALAEEARTALPDSAALVALDAKRDELYAARYAPDGTCDAEPAALALDAVRALLRPGMAVAGSGAALVVPDGGHALGPLSATADIGAFARLASRRALTKAKPVPLYLRGPDVRPQSGFALPRA